MPRPKINGGNGTWSIRQASATVRISQRATRDIAARGLIDPDAIGEPDILVLRTVHAVDQAGTLTPPDPVLGRMRDETVARLTRQAWTTPSPTATLAITSTDARLATSPAELSSLLSLFADQPLLLLPVGTWASASRTRAA